MRARIAGVCNTALIVAWTTLGAVLFMKWVDGGGFPPLPILNFVLAAMITATIGYIVYRTSLSGRANYELGRQVERSYAGAGRSGGLRAVGEDTRGGR